MQGEVVIDKLPTLISLHARTQHLMQVSFLHLWIKLKYICIIMSPYYHIGQSLMERKGILQ